MQVINVTSKQSASFHEGTAGNHCYQLEQLKTVGFFISEFYTGFEVQIICLANLLKYL